MSSFCFSLATGLRCAGFSLRESIFLLVPSGLELIFAVGLLVINKPNTRANLLIAAEIFLFFVLAAIDFADHSLSSINSVYGTFKTLDVTIGVLSCIPLIMYTTYLFLFSRDNFFPSLPHRYRKLIFYTLLFFIPIIAILHEIGSFIGVSYSRITPTSKSMLIIGFPNASHISLWVFFNSITLALFVVFQALVFSLAFYKLMLALLDQRRIEASQLQDNEVHFIRGLGWINLALKLGAIESVVGFTGVVVSAGYGATFARRVLRLVARACLIIGVIKGMDGTENFSFIRSIPGSSGRKKSTLKISNPLSDSFRRMPQSPRSQSEMASTSLSRFPYASSFRSPFQSPARSPLPLSPPVQALTLPSSLGIFNVSATGFTGNNDVEKNVDKFAEKAPPNPLSPDFTPGGSRVQVHYSATEAPYLDMRMSGFYIPSPTDITAKLEAATPRSERSPGPQTEKDFTANDYGSTFSRLSFVASSAFVPLSNVSSPRSTDLYTSSRPRFRFGSDSLVSARTNFTPSPLSKVETNVASEPSPTLLTPKARTARVTSEKPLPHPVSGGSVLTMDSLDVVRELASQFPDLPTLPPGSRSPRSPRHSPRHSPNRSKSLSDLQAVPTLAPVTSIRKHGIQLKNIKEDEEMSQFSFGSFKSEFGLDKQGEDEISFVRSKVYDPAKHRADPFSDSQAPGKTTTKERRAKKVASSTVGTQQQQIIRIPSVKRKPVPLLPTNTAVTSGPPSNSSSGPSSILSSPNSGLNSTPGSSPTSKPRSSEEGWVNKLRDSNTMRSDFGISFRTISEATKSPTGRSSYYPSTTASPIASPVVRANSHNRNINMLSLTLSKDAPFGLHELKREPQTQPRPRNRPLPLPTSPPPAVPTSPPYRRTLPTPPPELGNLVASPSGSMDGPWLNQQRTSTIKGGGERSLAETLQQVGRGDPFANEVVSRYSKGIPSDRGGSRNRTRPESNPSSSSRPLPVINVGNTRAPARRTPAPVTEEPRQSVVPDHIFDPNTPSSNLFFYPISSSNTRF